jgi:radical SAM superfamily enzyme YgiQ (UPF0313 family)
MRIALLSPYSEIHAIGLRTLSAVLKQNHIATRLVFLPLQKSYYSREQFFTYSDRVIDELTELLKDDTLIGISLMSNYHDSISGLTRKLKARLPDKPILWGGIHPTVFPEECINIADYLCIGEAEVSLLELCQHIAGGKPTDAIPGIWSRTNGKIARNTPCNIISDLNQIPPPDYDLDENYILVSKKNLIQITEKNIARFLGLTYWTMYTRGCPFSCSYCCNNALKKINNDLTKLRAKSPESMVQEISAIKRKFPFIKYVYFTDDTVFALSEDELREFATSYKKHIGLPFCVPGVQPTVFTEKKFDYLVDSGLLRIRMGIQSGSERVIQQIYNRKQDNKTVVKVAQLLQKYSHRVTMPNYDIILDNPWETKDDKLKTIELLSQLATPYSLNIYSLQFFPGTTLYDKALKENIIDGNSPLQHYVTYMPTYLNLITVLFGLFRIPQWLLKILLSEHFVNTKLKFKAANHLLYDLILFRRGFFSFFTRDFSMFPPRLQMLFCKILPSRIR